VKGTLREKGGEPVTMREGGGETERIKSYREEEKIKTHLKKGQA